MRRRHLNNKTFCVSQMCHTKEGEQYETTQNGNLDMRSIMHIQGAP